MRRTFRAGVLGVGLTGLLGIILIAWGVTMAKKQEAEGRNHKAEARRLLAAGKHHEAAVALASWFENHPEAKDKDPEYGAILWHIADAMGSRDVRDTSGVVMARAILKGGE